MQSGQNALLDGWLKTCKECMDVCISDSHKHHFNYSENYIKNPSNQYRWEYSSATRGRQANIHVHGSSEKSLYAELKMWHRTHGENGESNPTFEYLFNSCLHTVYTTVHDKLRHHLRECETIAFETDDVTHTSTIAGCYHDVIKQFLLFPRVLDADEHAPHPSKFCHIVIRQDKRKEKGYLPSENKHFFRIDLEFHFYSKLQLQYMFEEIERAFLGICTAEHEQPKIWTWKYQWLKAQVTASFMRLQWHPVGRKPEKYNHHQRFILASSQHKKSQHSRMHELGDDLVHKISDMAEEENEWSTNSFRLSIAIVDWEDHFEHVQKRYEKFTLGISVENYCAKCRFEIL